MINVVGVRFQTNGKMYYFDSGNANPGLGDYVIVETDRGPDLAEVILGTQEMNEEDLKASLPRVIRTATVADIQRATDNRAKEQEAYRICQQKIADHKLEMKLVSVESTFDNSKLLFYFTANGRVDFRALVKDLASVFRTRIELRQIGVRDEARMLGGLGPCGRQICCGSFLQDFQPVSIKMAKEQNLSLNPTKISGVCGRLMCCLKYEQDQYEQVRKKMPRIGRTVITPDGPGTASDLNIVKETLMVRIPTGDDNFEIKEYALEQISKPGQAAPSQPSEEAALVGDEAEPVEAYDDVIGEDIDLPIQSDMDSYSDPEGKRERPRRRTRNHAEEHAAKETQREEGRKDRPPRMNGNRNRKTNFFGKQDDESRTSEAGRQENGGKRGNSGRQGFSGKAPREQKFGQPVRRENANREKEGKNGPGTASMAEVKPSGAESPKVVQRKRSGWADAVEKALESSAASQGTAGKSEAGDA